MRQMSNSSFFAHNRLFKDLRQYASWTLWRWATAEDHNPDDISLSRCTPESVAECWQQWFSQRRNPRVTQADLIAAIGDVRRAIQFDRTHKLQVHPKAVKGDIHWPGLGVVEYDSKSTEL